LIKILVCVEDQIKSDHARPGPSRFDLLGKLSKEKLGSQSGNSSTAKPSSLSQSQEIGEDDWFKVFIEAPEGSVYQKKVQFMTKERHAVRKVLAGACKHFEVDPET
jgi:hypothetical protein